jgi:hypothetical protein
MENLRVLFKIFPGLTMLLTAGLPANAVEVGGAPPVFAETVPGSALGLPSQQSSMPPPPDSSPFVPDTPEKQKRVKELLNQIIGTYGLNFGREIGAISWGPRPRKLYGLHKKLTALDWQLLAEMYVSFQSSDLKTIIGIPCKPKDASALNNAMIFLLAMHGEISVEILNVMMAAIHRPLILRQGDTKRIEMFIKDKPWSDTIEYKKDQR